MEISFLIALLATVLSAYFVSSKVYKSLKNKNNEYAVIYSILCFILSFVLIGIAVFFVWFILFQENFSRG
jgi:hypothetical protein